MSMSMASIFSEEKKPTCFGCIRKVDNPNDVKAVLMKFIAFLNSLGSAEFADVKEKVSGCSFPWFDVPHWSTESKSYDDLPPRMWQ